MENLKLEICLKAALLRTVMKTVPDSTLEGSRRCGDGVVVQLSY